MTLEERFRALGMVSELRDIPTEARAALAASMREELFAPAEIVIAAGEHADRVFVLCHGMLEITQEGRAGVVRRLEPGTLLGELAFFADTPRTATVRALDTCILLSLPFENFRAFLISNPESLLVLTKRMVRTLRDLELSTAAGRNE
jgi:CRP-like cAMP-binding protein